MNNQKTSMVLVLAVLTLTIGVTPAFATHIEGQVTDGASVNTNAWITAESNGNYAIDYQPSSGDYYLGLNGATSTVSASKYGDERSVQTGVSSNANDIDFDINTRGKIHMRYVIATDGSISESTMRSHIQSAEDYFQEEHNINFLESSSPTWTSGSDTTYASLSSNVQSDVNWSSISGDILIAFLDDDDLTCNGVAAYACTTLETTGNNRPIIIIASDTPNFSRTIMHELSHSYGIDHDTSSCSSQVPSVMAISCGSDYIMNWNPSHDIDVENRRTWY